MFEQKKQAAQRTILKKQAKVDEINRIMAEEIQPVLDQLRSEKANFYKFNANANEIELLNRFATALAWYNRQSTLVEMEAAIEKLTSEQDQLGAEVEQAQMSVELKQRELVEIQSRRDREFSQNEAYQALESKGSELSKKLVQATTQWQNAKESLVEEEKELAKLRKNFESGSKSVSSKQSQAKEAQAKSEAASKDLARLQQDVANIRSAQLGIVVGEGEGKEGGSGGFAGQLMAAQKELAQMEGQAKSDATKLKHVQSTLKEAEAAAKASEKDGAGAAKEIASKTASIAALQKQLSGSGVDASKKAQMESRLSTLRDELAQLSYESDALEARLGSRLKFEYNPRSVRDGSVKGLVASLVRVPDAAHHTAVELTAGAKLYNVVVDTEETGKSLLEKGGLKKRVTLIPLNKINNKTVSSSIVQKAEAIGAAAGGSAKLALSVVGYDAEVSAAMSYIFGQSFIVSDPALAAKICFHPEIRTKCLTMDGDVYDPSGTLEGGALPSGPSIMAQLAKVNDLHAEKQSKEGELAQLTRQLQDISQAESKSQAAQKQLDVLQIELKSLKAREASSEHFALAQSVASSKAEVETLKGNLESNATKQRELKQRISELEGFIRDLEGSRASQGAMLEKKLASLAKESATAAKMQQEQAKKSSMLSIELSELEAEQKALEASIAKMESESIAALTASISKAESDVTAKRAEFDAFTAILNKEKEKHSALDKSLTKLSKEISSLQKRATEAQLEQKKSSNALARMVGEKSDAAKSVARMEKEHDFITKEKHLFGLAGGEFDFASAQGQKAAEKQLARLATLTAEQEVLSKRINKKVMGLFEKAESDAAELDKKRAIILDDKAQIETTIRELDIEKTRTLNATWQTVSESFGTIFSTLLPGVSAKLVLADGGKDVMDGLDIRVSFGGVEKESLSELSGGQRSLLALSLILALLKYKPAPMYILDEIDAALDLSHTQNIGHVLKTHFAESQVSLEGRPNFLC
jgi:structural maintenance of chromosome 2